MDFKKLSWIFAGLMIFSSSAHALQCDVDFRAKRVKTVTSWYGKVEKPEFRSGTVSGVGGSKKACVKDALKHVEKNGWRLTYQRVKRTY